MKNTNNFLGLVKRGLRLGSWPILQRYVVAPKISNFDKVRLSPSSNYSIHTLLNKKDLLMYEWMLRSLLFYSKADFMVNVHEDGSFSERDIQYLESKYQGLKVWRKSEVDRLMYEKLKNYPRLLDYREKDLWALKALDVYLLGSARYMILIDADILFFNDPCDLFKDNECNYWMEDVCYMLGIESEECEKKLGINRLQPMNAGLGRSLRKVLDLNLAEDFLKIQAKPVNDMIFHALFCTKFSEIKLLNHEYVLNFHMGVDNIIAKHYVNPIRFWFWEEGIPRLAKIFKIPLHHFLKERL